MEKFRKKLVVIEAEQWFKDGDLFWVVERYADLGVAYHYGNCKECGKNYEYHGKVKTLEGVMTVCPSDWIIKGIKGEYYLCKPDIFEKTYGKVEEEV